MDFYSLEGQDGVRLSWNNIPSTKLSATRSVLPIGVHYSPYRDLDNLAILEYSPVRCKCTAILNPYVQIDFKSKTWLCPFCQARNQLPPTYAQHISPQNLPAEIQQTYSSIEYIDDSNPSHNQPNVFLYMIDTCIDQIQMDALKTSIQDSLLNIPENSHVGLITFGRYVFVHELGFQDCPKSFALKGTKTYTPQQVLENLGMRPTTNLHQQSSEILKRFLIPLSECQFSLNSILDDLQVDSWPIQGEQRAQRATGCALNIAVSLLESCHYRGSRLMMFIGGPCTIGQGQVVGVNLVETIRSYLDISQENDNCKYVKNAVKYYQSIAQRAIKCNMVIDNYSFSIDQVGLMEMKQCSEKTGGYIVMNEEFNSQVFKETYKKIFSRDASDCLRIATAAKIDLFVSKELKIQGSLGVCSSLKKAGPMVAETEIGQGGTTSWYIGGLDKTTTLSFLFDISQQNKDQNTSKLAYFQFQTSYKTSNGQTKLRVTTIQRKFADPNSNLELCQGFDQEAACVLMARLGCFKAESEDSVEVLKWLDRNLIRVVSKFADFKPQDVYSFRLQKEFSLYPQFMYHLRRSHFIQTFGASPDEITFYRSTLNRENIANGLVMIQPALLQYNFENDQPQPVQLDQSSMKENVILLLDTYFQVLTWQGPHIKAWIEQGYLEKEEYQSLRDLVNSPKEDVTMIMEDRFPVPIFFETYEGHTKERYLKSRVNPSGLSVDLKESGHYITDDASLKLFMDHLIKLAVSQQN